MPGRPGSADRWGELALVVDTSAWARAHHRAVRADWTAALVADRLRLSPAARFEILVSARDGRAFDELATELSALRAAPLTVSVQRAAEEGMRARWRAGPAGPTGSRSSTTCWRRQRRRRAPRCSTTTATSTRSPK